MPTEKHFIPDYTHLSVNTHNYTESDQGRHEKCLGLRRAIPYSLVRFVHIEFLKCSVQVMHVPQSSDRGGIKLSSDQTMQVENQSGIFFPIC